VGGDAPEAIEILSGHILTTHLSDNHAQDDAHRAPGSGSVDWPAVLTELWKTGYAGPAIIELAADQDAPAALTRAVGARTRLQAILDDLAQPMVFPE
jgi:sugar phosphate isomerase/epimerase